MLNSKFKWLDIAFDQEMTLIESTLLKPVQELLAKRGTSEEEMTSDSMIHDAYLFTDMEKTIERIMLAIDEQHPILIYGDYDIDGVSATSILVRAISSLGGLVDFYIPNRFEEGYGPNEAAYEQAIGEGYELIITVDNGVSGIKEALLLAEHDVDYIITDHHQLKEVVPVAYSIVHPEYDEAYPFDHLCGAGVALKIAEALLKDELDETYYLLAMLGTIGDVVPLINENRTIVKRGLKALKQTKLPGILALATQLELTLSEATETTIGFDIGPVINAAGRMADAKLAVELLLAEDGATATELATQLVQLNSLRQKETQQVLEAAKQKLIGHEAHKIVVLYDEGWHEGVLGIVAGRLARELQKAVFVLTKDEKGLAKGSARGIEGLHLFELMTTCEQWLEKFGGHAQAAGVSLPIDNIRPFEAQMNELVADVNLQASLTIDLDLTLAEATLELYEQLQVLAPFGEGNRPPLVKLSNVSVSQVACIGNKKQHLKFTVEQDNKRLNVIGFNLAPLAIYLGSDDVFDVVGELKINEWNGNKTLQLQLQDIRCEAFQLVDLRNAQAYQAADLNLFKGIKYSEAVVNKSEHEHLIIDVLPDSKEQLLEVIHETKPMTVTLFPMNTTLILPKREKFIFVYKIVQQYKQLALNDQTFKAFYARGISKNEVMFILQVFFEIELVIIRNGSVFCVDSPNKRDLTTAPMYQTQQKKQQLLEFFELTTWREMKTIFINAREEYVHES